MFEELSRDETAQFPWNDPRSVIVKQVDAIAVYRNEDGDIVIRQHRPMAGEDPCIVVPAEEAGKLIEAIRQGMKAAAE
jgi:hypothetical protein